MSKTADSAAQALFKSISADGTCWLFVLRSDDGWAITRNGKVVGAGTSERASITAGVAKFLSLTRAIAASDAACDSPVAAQLDRIERGRLAARKDAKSHGRIRPYAPKESSAYLTTYGTVGS